MLSIMIEENGQPVAQVLVFKTEIKLHGQEDYQRAWSRIRSSGGMETSRQKLLNR